MMHSVAWQAWQAVKAVLAISALVCAALYSADRIDQQGLNPFALKAVDPLTTGSIGPRQPSGVRPEQAINLGSRG
ncbi:hypothetical protein [Methylobacterium nigriterrae]|uniref:hypothetical protein n=1 Tax=Methylobacterium nigriterrae TaxID=3127512 RepID=UPI003D6798F6